MKNKQLCNVICRAVVLTVFLLNLRAKAQSQDSKDAQVKEVMQLVQENHTTDALSKLDALIAVYPDDAKLKELRSEIAGNTDSSTRTQAPAVAGQRAPTAESLSKDDQLELDTLAVLYESFVKMPDGGEKQAAGQALLDRTGKFVVAHPENFKGWTYRAAIAYALNLESEGREAGSKLKAMGGVESDDPQIHKLIVLLNARGWLVARPPDQDSASGKANDEPKVSRQNTDNGSANRPLTPAASVETHTLVEDASAQRTSLRDDATEQDNRN